MACALPAFFAFNFVYRFAVKTVYWDDWELVPLIDRMYRGTLTFANLFSQHNEHRILFPRLVMLGVVRFAAYDSRVLIYLSWGLLVVSAGALLHQHLRLYGRSLRSLASFLPVPWMLFTLRQSDNLLWGWQISIILCVTAFVCAAVLLLRGSRAALWGAAACVVVSAFSLSAGFFAAPILLAVLWYVDRAHATPQRQAWTRLALWTVLTLLVTGLYLHGYTKPAHHPDVFFALKHPLQGLYVFFATLGGSVSGDLHTGDAAGVLLLAAMATLVGLALRRRADPERLGPALPLCLFGLATAAAVTLGRSGFGEDAANAVRYVSLTVLAPIGVYYGVLAVKSPQVRLVLMGALASLIVVGVFSGYDGAISYGAGYRAARARGAAILRSFETRSDAELSELYPNPEAIRARAPILKEHHLSVFAGEHQ